MQGNLARSAPGPGGAVHTGGIRHAVPEIAEQHRRFAHPGTESVITTFTASSARAQQALSAGSGVIIHEWVERWGGAERVLEAMTQALLMTSADHAEFYRAFTEGRDPRWSGR